MQEESLFGFVIPFTGQMSDTTTTCDQAVLTTCGWRRLMVYSLAARREASALRTRCFKRRQQPPAIASLLQVALATRLDAAIAPHSSTVMFCDGQYVLFRVCVTDVPITTMWKCLLLTVALALLSHAELQERGKFTLSFLNN